MSQTNRWTNSVSGSWQDARWLLGRLPGTNQTIFFKNPGWKTVIIGPTTARNYPQTLTVDSITLAAPTNSFNELLLKDAGLDLPLAANGLFVSNRAAVVVLNSVLKISEAGPLVIDSKLNQGNFASVVCDHLAVGTGGPGIYDLTNGTLAARLEDVSGTFNHEGGTNSLVWLNLAGSYRMHGGLLKAPLPPTLTWEGLMVNGTLQQSGGIISGQMEMPLGSYNLSGGLFDGTISVAEQGYYGSGVVLQTGGTNAAARISMGNSSFASFQGWGGSYVLSNGVVAASDVYVGRYGSFAQWGGLHTNDRLIMAGGIFIEPNAHHQIPPIVNLFARYTLGSGMLISPTISLWQSIFTQSGGTNQVGTMSISASTYDFQGGQLSAREIVVQGLFRHQGGEVSSQGIITMEGGTWEDQVPNASLGQLQVSGNGALTDSRLLLTTSQPMVLRFADSHSLVWSNECTLTIENWNGSPDGGGTQQVLVGNDNQGLTGKQVSQMRFVNPLGQPGVYPARLLLTGELVPKQLLVRQADGLSQILTWTKGDVLQSSTNAIGPYEDVAPAASPYPVPLTDPTRFFRLRGTAAAQ